MTQRSLAGLILINAVLLASLVVAAFSPEPAHAQLGGGRGEVDGHDPEGAAAGDRVAQNGGEQDQPPVVERCATCDQSHALLAAVCEVRHMGLQAMGASE